MQPRIAGQLGRQLGPGLQDTTAVDSSGLGARRRLRRDSGATTCGRTGERCSSTPPRLRRSSLFDALTEPEPTLRGERSVGVHGASWAVCCLRQLHTHPGGSLVSGCQQRPRAQQLAPSSPTHPRGRHRGRCVHPDHGRPFPVATRVVAPSTPRSRSAANRTTSLMVHTELSCALAGNEAVFPRLETDAGALQVRRATTAGHHPR